MASSSSSRKRKAPLTLEEALEELDQSKQRLHSVLHLVKKQMQKTKEAHSLRLQLERKSAKCAVVRKIVDGKVKNLEAAGQKYADESDYYEAALSKVEIPEIDWSKLGFDFMY